MVIHKMKTFGKTKERVCKSKGGDRKIGKVYQNMPNIHFDTPSFVFD